MDAPRRGCGFGKELYLQKGREGWSGVGSAGHTGARGAGATGPDGLTVGPARARP